MTTARIPPHDLWPLLLHSVRYAMGRMSTAPSTTADLVRQYARHLRAEQIAQIREEIATELWRHEHDGKTLGMRCDHETWRALEAWLCAHLAGRKEASRDG